MDNQIKMFSTFSGYGGWEFGLQEQGIDHELVGYSEVDKFAIQCFEQNHYYEFGSEESPIRVLPKNYGDITKINPHELPDFDLFVSSPPCQAFSVAGKGQGKDDEKGRGRLFEDAINIMQVKQPKYAVYENVKGLTFKKHKEYFDYIVRLMQEAGYNVFYKILNTKDFGIPQNRERIFFVCIRQDIDSSYFQFPQEFPLTLKLKDILEAQVDEKYYLKQEQVTRLLSKDRSFNERFCGGDTARTVCARDYKDPKVIPCLTPDRLEKRQNGRRFKEDGEPSFTLNAQDKHGILQVNNPNHSQQRVYDPEGISPTIAAGNLGGGKSPSKILQVGNIVNTGNFGNPQRGRVYSSDGVCPSLNCMRGGGLEPKIIHPTITQALGRSGSSSEYMKSVEAVSSNTLTIRKLTPRECFRLQGFLTDQINLEGLSDSQRYKLAGNGVSINVVGLLLKEVLNG